jgi:hypothetical protein
MRQALEQGDHEARLAVPWNLLFHAGPVDEALPVLRQALALEDLDIREVAVNALGWLGRRLHPEVALDYERQAKDDPRDCALRLLLLGHYKPSDSFPEVTRETRQRHVLWVIEHAPQMGTSEPPSLALDPVRDAAAHEKARQLWQRHAEGAGGDVAVLVSAGRWFMQSQPALAEKYFRKVCTLDPENPKWRMQLGRFYMIGLHAQKPKARADRAALALAELEIALGHGNAAERKWYLAEVAQAAFEAGRPEKARTCATELLAQAEGPDDADQGNGVAVFYANLVLGRLALANGDVERAKGHLLESATTSGSPFLNSGGPNMTLAKELLEAGERDAVAEFLRRCGGFWHAPKREEWLSEIEAGRTPDFGANLDY